MIVSISWLASTQSLIEINESPFYQNDCLYEPNRRISIAYPRIMWNLFPCASRCFASFDRASDVYRSARAYIVTIDNFFELKLLRFLHDPFLFSERKTCM